MDQWLQFLIAILTLPTGGIVGLIVRWWLARRERLIKEQRAHEDALQTRRETHDNAILARFEKLQENFLVALKVKDERIDRERELRFEAYEKHTKELNSLAQSFRDAMIQRQSQTPPHSTKT